MRNSVPIKQSEGEQNELLSLPERLNKTIENEIYGNMTDLRGELMRQIAEAIEVFERDLKRRDAKNFNGWFNSYEDSDR